MVMPLKWFSPAGFVVDGSTPASLQSRGYLIDNSNSGSASLALATSAFGIGPIIRGTGGSGWARMALPAETLESSFVVGLARYSVAPAGTNNANGCTIVDVNGIVLYLNISPTECTLTYNPAGTANDIDLTINVPPSTVNAYEIVWSAATLKLFLNNVEVYSKSWAGVTARPHYFWMGYVEDELAWWYYGPTRLGFVQCALGTLSSPTTDTSASVTGAASRQAALASFDGDTSYVTYTEGTGQETLLPAIPTLPAGSTIHAVKLVASAVGVGGIAAGSLQIETPDGTSNVGALTMALSYAPTDVVLTVDPATSNPFDAADLLAGDFHAGIVEG